MRFIVIDTTAEDVCEYFDASSDGMDSLKGIIIPTEEDNQHDGHLVPLTILGDAVVVRGRT